MPLDDEFGGPKNEALSECGGKTAVPHADPEDAQGVRANNIPRPWEPGRTPSSRSWRCGRPVESGQLQPSGLDRSARVTPTVATLLEGRAEGRSWPRVTVPTTQPTRVPGYNGCRGSAATPRQRWCTPATKSGRVTTTVTGQNLAKSHNQHPGRPLWTGMRNFPLRPFLCVIRVSVPVRSAMFGWVLQRQAGPP